MSVIVAGPEGSGTRYLTSILVEYLGYRDWDDLDPQEHGPDVAVHHPMPGKFAGFWDWRSEWIGDDPKWIILQRRPDVTQLSLLQHHHWRGERHEPLRATWQEARDKWQRAMTALAQIPGAYWISYEALMAAPGQQAANLAAWLGREPVGEVPPAVDANPKWLSFLERAA